MKILLAVLLFISFTFFTCYASDVIVLDHKNFREKTSKGTWFIEFYSNGCGWCAMLEPTWEELAKMNKGVINVAKINGMEEDELSNVFGVSAYPSLFVVKDGKRYAYTGSRKLLDLQKFAVDGEYLKQEAVEIFLKEKKEISDSVKVLTDENFDRMTSKGKWFVEFYAPWCGWCKRLDPTWKELANLYVNDKEINIAKLNAEDERATAQRLGVNGFPTMLLIKDGKYQTFEADRTIESFKIFVQNEPEKKIPPPVFIEPPNKKPERVQGVDLDENNFAEVTAKGHWLVTITTDDCPFCEGSYQFIKPFLDKYPSLNYGFIDANKHPQFLSSVSFHTGVPTGHIVYGGRTWIYPGPLGKGPEIFDRFLNNFLYYEQTKELPAHLRKGPPLPKSSLQKIEGTVRTFGDVPQKQQQGQNQQEEEQEVPQIYKDQSRIINNSTLIELVGGGDWLIEFYTPWCGHCKAFQPGWAELTNEPVNFRFGKVNCDEENFVCSIFEIGGYPSFFYLKSGNLYEFNGDRSKEKILSFTRNGYLTSSEKKPFDKIQNIITSFHQYSEDQKRQASVAPAAQNVAFELFDKDFESKTSKGVWVVLFYASTACTDCPKVRAEFAKLAKESNGLFFVGQINAETQHLTSMKYSVASYPYVLVFSGDNVYIYDGVKDAASLKKFIGQGISSFAPLVRDDLDSTGFSFFFVNQLFLDSLSLSQVYNYVSAHFVLFLISALFFAFVFGIFIGINISNASFHNRILRQRQIQQLRQQQQKQQIEKQNSNKEIKKEDIKHNKGEKIVEKKEKHSKNK